MFTETMRIPDFDRDGSTMKDPACEISGRATLEFLAGAEYAWRLRVVSAVPRDQDTPPLPSYLRFAQKEIEQRRQSTEKPTAGDWHSNTLTLPLRLELPLSVSFYTLLDGQVDMFDSDEDDKLPVLTEVPCTAASVKAHVKDGELTITHTLIARCATDLRPILGCNVLLQWAKAHSSDEEPLPPEAGFETTEL